MESAGRNGTWSVLRTEIVQIDTNHTNMGLWYNVGAGFNLPLQYTTNITFYSLMNFCTMPLAEPVEVRGFP